MPVDITRIIFGFTQIREGIGSNHWGILGTYTTNFRRKYHQLESRAWLTKAGDTIYQRHYVSEEAHKVTAYEGHCRIKSDKRV